MNPSSPVTEHTPTPWVYRPNEHDDWGWIRDADGNLAATARDGRVWSENFDRYRAAKADPYEPNAAFIVKAVNNHAPMLKSLESCAKLFDLLAVKLDRWATESQTCGWSTHQVSENLRAADDCRRYASQIRTAIPSPQESGDAAG